MNFRRWSIIAPLLLVLLAGLAPWRSEASVQSKTKEEDVLPADTIVVEALIDGQSELRVRKDGLYWIHNGDSAKPGRHDKANAPTYINGKPWVPVWNKNGADRGPDQCKPYVLSPPINPAKMDFKLVSVTEVRGAEGIDVRDPIKIIMVDEELSITIPDRQIGSRWYKFMLVRKK